MNIVKEWFEDVRRACSEKSQIIDARIGVFYTAVQLSTAHAGVAFTPRDLSDTVCCPKTAAGAPPAGRLVGERAWRVAEYAWSPSPLRRALGVATLNALSAAAIDRFGLPEGALRIGTDALDAAEIVPGDRVAMVGAFIPFIKALKSQKIELRIIDKHPGALRPDERRFWVPTERASEELKRASIVIITGSALVEGGLDDLLTWATAARRRVLAGPTAPLWPRPFFERGVHVLGGIRILDPAKLLPIVGQGGSGYMFAEAAQKACLVRSASKLIATDDSNHSALAANRPTDSTQTEIEAARMFAGKRV
jgi:uncharacterized protein